MEQRRCMQNQLSGDPAHTSSEIIIRTRSPDTMRNIAHRNICYLFSFRSSPQQLNEQLQLPSSPQHCVHSETILISSPHSSQQQTCPFFISWQCSPNLVVSFYYAVLKDISTHRPLHCYLLRSMRFSQDSFKISIERLVTRPMHSYFLGKGVNNLIQLLRRVALTDRNYFCFIQEKRVDNSFSCVE